MKNPQNKNKNRPLSEETRNVLDTAITNIVQALGSKASVLVFWEENRDAPSYFSTFGLSSAAFEEVRPYVIELSRRLSKRAAEGNDEPTAMQNSINLQQGPLQLIALPIQIEGRFIAVLCLLQPATSTYEFAGLWDPHALPSPHHILVTGQGFEDVEDFETPPETALKVDQGELVTRNARLLKRLVEEMQRLEAIISYSPDGILIVDRDCKIIGFNPAFARLCGWSVEELRGRECAEGLSIAGTRGGDHCSMHCPLKLGLRSNGDPSQQRAEVVLLTKNGEQRYVELSYSVIRSPRGDILGGIIGARDITARKEAEELQNTFLSVVSHELQTPIAIIKGYAGLYADETTTLEPDQVREKMQIIREESDRLSKLVDNLLYASRIQAGGIEIEHLPVDLTGLLKRVVKKMKSVSPHHQLEDGVPEDLPSVLGDYDKIQEVMVNLIENAIKYSPKGGTIEISAEPTNTEVIISVTDQGIGVPEAERQRIFDRFSRLDSRYVRERKGAGLGLYICKAIVEAHGGRIWVEAKQAFTAGEQTVTDRKSDSGSRFCFSLPRELPAQLPVLFGRI